jgi:AhpD family alkylhydroperoxidase
MYPTLSREEISFMTRKQVYKEIEEMFGQVPTFVKEVPEDSLEAEWKMMKTAQFDEGPIPNKYRELIGLAISAVTKCRYCAFFHTEAAKLNGATEAEIHDAVRYAKSSAAWSAWLNGLQFDFEQFKTEVRQMCEHAGAAHAAK